MSYKFKPDLDGPNEFGSTLPVNIDWFTPGIQWAFGLDNGGGADVNGYPVLTQPGAYTDLDGKTSYEALLNFYADETRYPMWRRVNLAKEVTPIDSSCYASCSAEQGLAIGTPCGVVTECFSETTIFSPIFSKFTIWEQDYYRTHSTATMSGGGGMYLGGRLMEAHNVGDIYNKKRPIFKTIDFNEFYEVIALTIGLAMEQAISNIVDNAPLIVPLTVQDFRIMLRQTIMAAFQQSQALGQDLGYDTTSNFIPFLTSSGTVGKPAIAGNVMLPLVFVENIRALHRRLVPAGKSGVIDFIPIWGVYEGDNVTNYTWGPNNLPLFTVDALEAPINLIEGSALQLPNTKVFVDLNSEELTTNIAKWNEFLLYLTPYLSSTGPLGTDKGISCCEMVTLSLTTLTNDNEAILPVSSPVVAGNKRASSKAPIHLGKKKTTMRLKQVQPEGGVGQSSYSSLSACSVTSNQQFLNAPYTEIQNFWIMPCSRSNGLPFNSGSMIAYQCSVCEPYSLSVSPLGSSSGVAPGTNIIALYDRHVSSAQANVRAVFGEKNTVELKLQEAEKTGRGGFFGSMIGEAVGSIFGQPAIGKTLGGIIPI